MMKQRRRIKRGMLASIFALIPLHSSAENLPDYLGYPVGSTVKIYINWNSFEEQGIPSSWKKPFTDSVINAYTRWVHVGSLNLKPKFHAYTTKVDSGAGEIVISMNEKHSDSNRIASRFGKPATIVFHRKRGATNTDWNFTPYREGNGKIDMQSVLMHELGHAFGLEHNTNGSNKSVMSSYTFRGRFGPYEEDISDIQAVYGQQNTRDVKILRSTDSGASWANYETNLTSLGVTTTNTPTAVRDPDRSIFFYTTTSKNPAWIIGNYTATTFDTRKWWVYGGERSAFGTTGAGWGNEYMMAWVDDKDNHRVNVAFSNNGAESFGYRNPPAPTTSYGTPALYKASENTWILAYTKNHTSDEEVNGRIAVRVSTDDGVNWGPEVILNDFYHAESGVTITGDGEDDIRIGFSWSRTPAQGSANNYLKRAFRAHIVGGDIIYDGMIYESEGTRTQPSYTKNYSRMLQAWREPNFNTSVNTRFSSIDSLTWDNILRPVESTPVTPTVAAYKNYGYAYLYYLEE